MAGVSPGSNAQAFEKEKRRLKGGVSLFRVIDQRYRSELCNCLRKCQLVAQLMAINKAHLARQLDNPAMLGNPDQE